MPVSQLGKPDIENPADAAQEGQPVDLSVIEVDPIHHRIVLAVVGYPDIPFEPLPKREIPADEDDTEPDSESESATESEESGVES